jgi:hypothetical protein
MGSDKNRPGVRERKPQKPIQHTGNTRPPRQRQTIRSDGADSALKKGATADGGRGRSAVATQSLNAEKVALPADAISAVCEDRQSDSLQAVGRIAFD